MSSICKKRKNKGISSKDSMWIYGKHAVKAVLFNQKREILRFVLLESSKNFIEDVSFAIKTRKISYEIVDSDFFFSLFGKNAIHQGCAILVKKLKEQFLEELIIDKNDDRPFIFLDQVIDPQNIGSIMRAAAVFGARAVVMTEDHSPEITATVAKTASGALENIPLIKVVNLTQSLNLLKKNGFWVVGLDERSEKNLADIDLSGKFVFIIGSEGFGMRRLTKESCDFLAKLPGVSSFTTLNAAQAATISLYESCKQRKKGIEK
ncbi:MAG: 23S rRNA (guanosine(2251)-2'-O)-methyltransferase RlmB [Alphaproteobacteria bacterium]|nr:23S rRNA (guanosine(2251)-2'-O)-methyltransferase RlmB [Alphaproteobacteria bacterium]